MFSFCIKKTGSLLTLVFLSVLVHAQDEYDQDSVRKLSEENQAVMDTVEVPLTDTTYEEDYNDAPAVTTTIYFMRKEYQANGGGPDSLQQRKLPDSVLQRLNKDDNFWYVNYVFEKEANERKKKELKSTAPFTEGPLFQTILWLVIIGGFAAFVIIYLSNSNVGLFRKKSKPMLTDEQMEADTDNIFEINYQREIDRAVSNGNYRFAVRLMFLRQLKNLSDKNVIQYKPDRTNFDYLLQLHPTKYYHDFFQLTRNYEYSWYGQFDIDPQKFGLIRKDFENFDSKLR
jgi:hypothetical protein